MKNNQLFPIRFDNFKVDAADMLCGIDFKNQYPVEASGLTNWALRSLLIRQDNRNILIDTGFGNKQDSNFFEQYHLNGNFSLQLQLQEIGLSAADITDVVLTHLHFDHCGGCLLKNDGDIAPTFPNAKLWITQIQWDAAINPDPREKDSFLPENISPLPTYYDIRFVQGNDAFSENINFNIVNGHTKGQLIPIIKCGRQSFLFGGDLFPSSVHIDPGMNMSYDMDINTAICEKSDMLEYCLDNNIFIIFQHGLYVECCSLKRYKSRIVVDQIYKIQQFN